MTPNDPRLEAIVEVLLAFARQDFTPKAPVSDELDAVDAIATGLNMLAEELTGSLASRKELEAAYVALRDAQAKLVHSGKLAAIGQLASGVAHEINNPAGWVLASLEVLQVRLADARAVAGSPEALSAPERERLAALLREADALLADAAEGMNRIRAVTGDLRTFARADGDALEPLRLDDPVRSACNLARASVQRRAELVLDLQENVRVMGNRGRLGQVVANLLVNAAQAIQGPRGQIRVETRARGGTAVLAVEDSGPGVPLELRERIFEPFFTTKPAGIGTGLGLSLVAEIVSHHRGSVRVDTGALGGARFEVALPLLPAPAVELPRPALPQSPSDVPRSRILIIDDEPKLLRTYAMLLGADHDVQVAGGGREALELLEKDLRFDIVLCDLQMPEVDGVAVYERLQALSPELCARVLFATGGAVHPRTKAFLARQPVPILEKPIRLEVLLDALARLRAAASA